MVLALAGCNLVKLTADSTADVMVVASPAFNMESDVDLAREAAPGQIKMVEGFLLASPENKTLLTLAAKGYCEYTFGFIEDERDQQMVTGHEVEADRLGERATRLYLRCLNYALRILGDGWEKALHGDVPTFEKKVKGAGKDELPGLFFAGIGLASAINLNRDDIELVAYMAKARLLFQRVLELDDRYYNGSAHIAMGMLDGATPAALGGRPDLARKHFDRAIEITEGRYLMHKVLLAAGLAAPTGDQVLYRDTLEGVLRTDPAVWPEERLSNELAQRRARRMLAHQKEWF